MTDGSRKKGFLSLISLLLGMALAGVAAQAFPQSFDGDLKLEWLTWSFFRITSPGGKVIFTNPWLTNPDSKTKLEDIDKADIILIATGHRRFGPGHGSRVPHHSGGHDGTRGCLAPGDGHAGIWRRWDKF